MSSDVPELPTPEPVLPTQSIINNASAIEKTDFFKNIQTVLDSYHISVLHIAIVIFVCTLWLLYFVFEERVKDFGRTQVRQLLFSMQTERGKNKVSTTSSASKSKLVQFLTYLEQSWLASSDPSKNVKLSSNVHLDEAFQPNYIDEEESYSSDEEEDEVESKLFNKRDV